MLNAARRDRFHIAQDDEYKNWQQVLNTTETVQAAAFYPGSETKAPPRSACLCGRSMNDRQFGLV